MGERDDRRNAKLGIFVLIGVILILIAIFFIGNERNMFNKTFTLYTKFSDVSGLKKGNNVWLNGVKIGVVRSVDIVSDSMVGVAMQIREENQRFINEDASAYLGSDGLVGNTIVIIKPGVIGDFVEEGDTIRSTSVASTQDIIDVLKSSGDNLKAITQNLVSITNDIEKGEGTLGYLLNNNDLPKDIQQAVNNLQVTGRNSAALTRDLSTMVNKLQTNEDGIVYTLLNDKSFAQVYDTTLTNIKTTGENLAEVSKELNQLTTKINENNNAINVLVEDSTFANNLQRSLRNAAEGTEKFEENMEALQHNFLLRGFFKKKKKREAKEKEERAEELAEQQEINEKP